MRGVDGTGASCAPPARVRVARTGRVALSALRATATVGCCFTKADASKPSASIWCRLRAAVRRGRPRSRLVGPRRSTVRVGPLRLVVQQLGQALDLPLHAAVEAVQPRRLLGNLLMAACGLLAGPGADVLGLRLGGAQLLLRPPPRSGLHCLGVAGRAGAYLRGLLLGQAQQLLGAEPEAVLGRRVDVVVPRVGRGLRAPSTRPVAERRAAGLDVTPERGVLFEQPPDVLVALDAVVAAQHQVEPRA